MTFIVTSDKALSQVVAPRLPAATEQYDVNYINQLNNVLRLYFNQIDKIISQISISLGYIPALTVYTVATLPSASVVGIGARSFVSDALAPTFGSTVTAGGVVAVPVYSDGTNWKVG
jgi:hypothetical protein